MDFILEGVENWAHYLSMRSLNNCCKPWMVRECKITRRCEGELINNDDHHTAVHWGMGLNKMNKCTRKSNIKQCYYGMHNIKEWLIWQWLSYLWLDKEEQSVCCTYFYWTMKRKTVIMDTMNKFLKVNEMDYAHSFQNGAMTWKGNKAFNYQ